MKAAAEWTLALMCARRMEPCEEDRSDEEAMMAEHRSRMEHELSTGARPVGATSEETAAANVQRMFDSIAPKYDLLNHLLSMGLDRQWWARTARTFRDVLERPDAAVLDLCCGRGDMTMALVKHRPVGVGEGPVYAVDFSHES
jgi:demethylmenaquinone methyltransferase/2-methoxy-6-polyprenyl-1,4-benzoquinol methylase